MKRKYIISKETLENAWKRWTTGKASIPKLAKEIGCPSAILYQNFVSAHGGERVRYYGKLAHTTFYNPMKKKTIFHRYSKEKAWELFKRFKESGLSLRTFSKNKELCPIGEVSARKLFLKYFPAEYEALVEEHLAGARTYRKGRTFEYRVRDDLRKKGYFVLRSPRSAGPFDLIGLKRGKVLLVECKLEGMSGLHPKDKKRIDDLIDLAKSLGAEALLASRVKEKVGSVWKVKVEYRQLN